MRTKSRREAVPKTYVKADRPRTTFFAQQLIDVRLQMGRLHTCGINGGKKLVIKWKQVVAAGLLCFAVTGPVSAAGGCQQPDRMGEAIDVRGGRKLQVVEQTIVDNAEQSTLRQKLLMDDGQPVTQEDARAVLMEMFDRAKASCRKYPLRGVIMFLFGNRDAVVGTNWLARLDTRSGMTYVIDVQPALFSGGSSTSICDDPNAPKPKGKQYRSSDEVTLPPLNQRKVLGTWMGMQVMGGTCSRSFEEVHGRVYEVVRCSDCSGGKTGTPLVKGAGNTFTRPARRNGEYFRILPNGNLASYDRDGLIDNYPRLSGLWPQDR